MIGVFYTYYSPGKTPSFFLDLSDTSDTLDSRITEIRSQYLESKPEASVKAVAWFDSDRTVYQIAEATAIFHSPEINYLDASDGAKYMLDSEGQLFLTEGSLGSAHQIYHALFCFLEEADFDYAILSEDAEKINIKIYDGLKPSN